eukprot:TRINITY_DN4549_c0_g1_i1.p1 TRINITY_DN4549_c0_g1~~TRINITY_DN4549_c0_g1_i1.p1  ORF type:complete len:170 (-),score=21.18 TRINITY_DN4549_c0_g1_i1:48-557(-)
MRLENQTFNLKLNTRNILRGTSFWDTATMEQREDGYWMVVTGNFRMNDVEKCVVRIGDDTYYESIMLVTSQMTNECKVPSEINAGVYFYFHRLMRINRNSRRAEPRFIIPKELSFREKHQTALIVIGCIMILVMFIIVKIMVNKGIFQKAFTKIKIQIGKRRNYRRLVS